MGQWMWLKFSTEDPLWTPSTVSCGFPHWTYIVSGRCYTWLMKVAVTEQGFVIPKTMLEDVAEVDIRKEHGRVVLVPVPKDDPIFRIGKNPVTRGLTDAFVDHDKYIYSGK